MSEHARGIPRLVAAVGVAAALAFGASQAVAGVAPPRRATTACDPAECNSSCLDKGAFGGFCGPTGLCICEF